MISRLRGILRRDNASVYNGVVVPEPRPIVVPDEKEPNVSAITSVCSPGDTVIIVGGGMGVTSIHAARSVAPDGRVVVYEGAREPAAKLREVARRNDTQDMITIHHAVVGEPIELYGSMDGASIIPPGELPPCDVLELDCEGSEVEILGGLRSRPRAIVVETHPEFGASTSSVRSIADAIGYTVAESVPDRLDGDVLTCLRRGNGVVT